MGVKKGFTLIETIVVLVVLSLTIPTIFAIIFGIVRQQTKIYRLSKVKEEGDFILNTTATLVKNSALSIHSGNPPSDANEECASSGESYSSTSRLFFKDQEGDWFRILLSSDKISSYSSSTTTSVFLNSGKTIVSGLSIGCDRVADYSPPVVNLSFDICYVVSTGNCTSTRPEETASLHYQTKIKLRNF